MLVAPILEGSTLHGVLQIINNKNDQAFSELDVEGVSQLCKTLGTAIRQRVQRAEENLRRRSTKFDGLIAAGVLTADDLQHCLQEARSKDEPVEQVLLAHYKVRPAQIGASLAKFF